MQMVERHRSCGRALHEFDFYVIGGHRVGNVGVLIGDVGEPVFDRQRRLVGWSRTATLCLGHERQDNPHQNYHADKNQETSNHLASVDGKKNCTHGSGMLGSAAA